MKTNKLYYGKYNNNGQRIATMIIKMKMER